ncbi:MAG: TlpA family protein disulfide reductase [Bacteroidetes bacterium HGW-Bacteroidetes-5]|jgi:thiol-disulfide isomerase/thioredoxin|nr:MAG: TlpA family protein disulfide reductase [Bacteroidetes bacterium HGW-Bacteroidetes-5]
MTKMKSLITPYNFLLFTLTLFSFTVNGQQSNSTTVNPGSIADPVIKVVDYGGLIPVYTKQNDTLYVVNFWATWCRPCVEELPHFMAVDGKYRGNKKYKMILVSLDDAEKANGTVKNFAKRLKLDVDHYLLDDIKKMNEWIPSVDKSWSGSIPATLFIKNGKSLQFVENSLSMDELESIIKLHL